MSEQEFQQAYEKLNPQQKEAVDTIEGPVMVIAGPGTGKTQILTLRIANILNLTDSLPQNILALTFTENAAVNMRKRLAQFIGPNAYKVKINTFHSFCNDVIANHPEKFNFRTDLEALDEFSSYQLLRALLDEFDCEKTYEDFINKIEHPTSNYSPKGKLKLFSDPYFYQKEILQVISQLKREFISPEKYRDLILGEIDELNAIEKKANPKTGKPTGKWSKKLKEIEKNIELLGIYEIYQERLIDQGKYDYNDMINFVVEAFEKEDDLLAAHQEQYQYILVDEYQDTNGSQNRVVQLLGSWDESPNIFVVGDDDQSIFRFQGANLSNIMQFKTSYPEAKVITITENYRSTQKILDFAQAIIENNEQRLVNELPEIDKNIHSANDYPNAPKVQLAKFSREEIENFWIGKQIKELVEKGTPLNEISIIYRKHRDVENLVEILQKFKIRVTIALNRNLLEDVFIKNILDLFKLVYYPDNNALLSRALNYEFIKLKRLDVFKAIRYANINHRRVIDVITSMNLLKNAEVEDGENLQEFGNRILNLRDTNINKTFLFFVQALLKELGVYIYLKENKDYEKIINLNKLVNFIKKRSYQDNEYDLQKFVTDIDVMEKSGITLAADSLELKTDSVNLLTAHASKGLEFEHVFIPKFTEGNWSNIRNISKLKLISITNEDIEENETEVKNEEERRLFFVAATRAKKHLYICHSEEYISGDLKTTKANPSQFLSEIKKDKYEEVNVESYENNIEEVLELSLEEVEPFTFQKDEKAYLNELLSTFKLSPTALNTYIADPKEFLYKYVLKVPEEETKEMALGSAIHNSIEFLNNKLKTDGQKVSLDEMLKIYRASLANHILTKEDREASLKEGERIISDWYTAKIDELTVPLFAEYNFFPKNIYLEDIPLEGKIDRIEKIDDFALRVIDYKSGSHKYKSQIVGPLKSKDSNYYRQMLFYKILCDLDHTLTLPVQEISLEFLRPKDGKFKECMIEFTNEEIDEMKKLISEIMADIRSLKF